jgi:hypothetical protein
MLNFKYCECGCKGHLSITIGHTSFWIFDSLKGIVCLHRGHGWTSPLIGQYSSYDKAVRIATEEAGILLEKQQVMLDELRRQINAKPLTRRSFEHELRAQFSGSDNIGLRKIIRDCTSSKQIRLLAKSVALTELGRNKIEIVADAFDRLAK